MDWHFLDQTGKAEFVFLQLLGSHMYTCRTSRDYLAKHKRTQLPDIANDNYFTNIGSKLASEISDEGLSLKNFLDVTYDKHLKVKKNST